MSWARNCAAIVACAPAAFAQAADEVVRVEVRITSVAGASHYVDKGRASGLADGDRVTFFPHGAASVTGTVRAVSKSGARVELDPGSATLAVGTSGEARVPAARLAPPFVPPPTPAKPTAPAKSADSASEATPGAPSAPETKAQEPEVPAHPPWTHPPESWATDTPLLAPAFGVNPEERETRWRGRAWTQLDATVDSERGDRKYLLSRTGADVVVENPFGQGGSLRVDAHVYARSADSRGGSDTDTDSGLQVDRLTYEIGGTDDRPSRWQFGRFLQHELPELGLLDGVEWGYRTDGGSRIGASAGWIPETRAGLPSFHDLQAAVFYRHVFDDRERHALGVAVQNTWHDGESDRNLVLAKLETRPSDDLTLRTTAWVDLYTSDDELKGSGAELTELRVDGTWRIAKSGGLGFFASTQHWPELLRDEDEIVDVDTIADGHVERLGAWSWWSASQRTRLSVRADVWSDEDDSGTNGELGATMRDLLGERGDLSAAVFYADGSYSSGPGARLHASKAFGRALCGLGYEFVDYEQKDAFGDQAKLAQQGVFATLDVPIGDAWDLLLRGDHRFGDEQDSYALGFLLQTRF